jgi:DNA-binding MarR family transcriptional regulator
MQAYRNQKNNRSVSPDAPPDARGDDVLHLERWLPFRLFTVSVRVADVLTGYYGPRFGLNRAAWRTMAIVSDRPGASAKEICQASGLDQFAVSRAIASLVEGGLARRRTGRSDKRCAALALTESGWYACVDISAVALRIEAELTATISPAERAMLDDVLRRLDDASARILARGWRGFAPDPERDGEDPA